MARAAWGEIREPGRVKASVDVASPPRVELNEFTICQRLWNQTWSILKCDAPCTVQLRRWLSHLRLLHRFWATVTIRWYQNASYSSSSSSLSSNSEAEELGNEARLRFVAGPDGRNLEHLESKVRDGIRSIQGLVDCHKIINDTKFKVWRCQFHSSGWKNISTPSSMRFQK